MMKAPENTKSYANIFLRNQTEPVYCYRSGLTVYEERLLDGARVPGGWNAAGYPLNVLSNYPSFIDLKTYAEPTAFHVELASHDRTRAAITVFTVPGSRAERINLIPRGLDLSHTYWVTLDNTGETITVTGRDLMVNGVTTRIMGIMTSELILIEVIDQ